MFKADGGRPANRRSTRSAVLAANTITDARRNELMLENVRRRLFYRTATVISLFIGFCVAACGQLPLIGNAPRSPASSTDTPASPDANAPIGTLRTEGANVSINKRAAGDGDSVRSGDSLSTGSNSKARVDFSRRGLIELAPDTDPEFRLIREGSCLAIRILSGKVFVDTNGSCAQLEGAELVATLHGQVHVEVTKERAAITVLQGEVSLIRSNRVLLTVDANEELIVRRNAQPAKRTVARAEIDNLMRWRTQKFSSTVPVLKEAPSQNDGNSGSTP